MPEENEAREQRDKKEEVANAREDRGQTRAKKESEKPPKKEPKRSFWFQSLLFWGPVVACILVSAYFVVDKVVAPFLLSSQPASIEGTGPASEEEGIGPVYSLDPIVVNLADEGAKRYLKITLNLELDNSEVVKEMDNLKPRLLDSLITLLSSKKLRDVEGMEDKVNLRREILAQFNKRLSTGRVIGVYFEEFIIQ